MSTYDTLIIGGGLTGLLLTHRLKQAGHHVHLVEARETLGGQYRRTNPANTGRAAARISKGAALFRAAAAANAANAAGMISGDSTSIAPLKTEITNEPDGTTPQNTSFSSPGVEFYPATNETTALFDWLKQVAPTPIRPEITEHRPQIFEDGRWKAFSGFGESEFLSIDQLASFSHTHEVKIEPAMEQLVRVLVEQLPISASTMSEVTNIRIDEEGKVSEVIINGEKIIKAGNIIFTPFPTALNDLITGEGLQAKHRTRLAKMDSWTAVVLELKHATPLTEDSHIRVFNHNAKEFEPVVGRVIGTTSKWMTLIPQERDAEHEFAGQNIRHIKRQLKRAWPEALEGPQEERIYILPKAFGQHSLKTKDSFRFPEISNLYVASQTLAAKPGSLGSLEMAKNLEELLVGSLNELPELGASC